MARPRRVPLADLVRDATRTISARPGRAIGLGLAVALGVATFVGMQSMTASGHRQAQRQIAALRPDMVELSPNTATASLFDNFGPGAVGAMDGEPGVRASLVVHTYADATVQARLGDDAQQAESAPVMGIEGDVAVGTRSHVTGPGLSPASTHGNAHVALVGAALADRLGLADPATHPTIWVDGVPFTVAGVLSTSTYLSASIDAVLILRRVAIADFGNVALDSSAYVRTVRGEADQVAADLPLRLTPQQPERWTVEVPTVPVDVAEGISDDLRKLSLAMAGLVTFIGVVAIGNAMMRAVYDRMPEIGLRRSLGARGGSLVALLLLEASLIGLIAGVIGVAAGALLGLAVAHVNHWPLAVPLGASAIALPAAVLAGALGGALPAFTAMRITPSQALRRD